MTGFLIEEVVMICCHLECRFLRSFGSWGDAFHSSSSFFDYACCLCSPFLFWDRSYLVFLSTQLIDDFLIIKKCLISCFISLIHHTFHNIFLQLMESHELENCEFRKLPLISKSKEPSASHSQKPLMQSTPAWRTIQILKKPTSKLNSTQHPSSPANQRVRRQVQQGHHSSRKSKSTRPSWKVPDWRLWDNTDHQLETKRCWRSCCFDPNTPEAQQGDSWESFERV